MYCSLCKECFVSVHKLNWTDRKRALPRTRARFNNEHAIDTMVYNIPDCGKKLLQTVSGEVYNFAEELWVCDN